jgi:hypothetical protein
LFFVIKQVRSAADAMPTDAIRANADPASNFFIVSSQKTRCQGISPSLLAIQLMPVLEPTLRDSRPCVN